VPTTKPTESIQGKDESVLVLTIGEVATRLAISRGEVERMIAAGKMRALETGFTLMVPVSEVERLC
jgi:excisionase family DNA binding protein